MMDGDKRRGVRSHFRLAAQKVQAAMALGMPRLPAVLPEAGSSLRESASSAFRLGELFGGGTPRRGRATSSPSQPSGGAPSDSVASSARAASAAPDASSFFRCV